MRQISLFAFALLILLGMSCKKDHEIHEDLTSEVFSPEFYVNGKIIDHKNEEEIDFSIETEELPDDFIGYNRQFVGAKSTTGTQTNTEKKFVAAATGKDLLAVFGGSTNTTEDLMIWVRNSIVVKVVTENEPDDPNVYGENLTKEELLKIFEVGSVLSFGTDPYEVEVAFHHNSIDGYPDFGDLGYYALSTWHPNNDQSTFKILSVEEYFNPQIVTQEKGLLVKAKINCNLGHFPEERMTLEDVEVLLMFNHS